MANPPTQADLIAQAKRLAELTRAHAEANPLPVNGPVVAPTPQPAPTAPSTPTGPS